MKAAIVGLEGPELTPDEISLFRAMPPAGVILFARNITGPRPLARLVGDLREVLAPECVLMVDQEGGRNRATRPPDWLGHPSAGQIGTLYAGDPEAGIRAAWLTGALIGLDCAEAGFDVVCAPVLDVFAPGGTEAIGDRSFGTTADQVIALAQAMAEGLLSAGVQPVGKHAPGHGKSRLDSHLGLPRIGPDADLAPDIAVFSALSTLPWMMTAHIIYAGLDNRRAATLSPTVIDGVIRGSIGFDGVLVSDDLAMGALSGPVAERVRGSLAAGCDLAMHCSGRMEHTSAVLAAAPELSAHAVARMAAGRAMAERCRLQLDRAALLADRAGLIG
jgi:beta-N-acetylhexosaminidase